MFGSLHSLHYLLFNHVKYLRVCLASSPKLREMEYHFQHLAAREVEKSSVISCSVLWFSLFFSSLGEKQLSILDLGVMKFIELNESCQMYHYFMINISTVSKREVFVSPPLLVSTLGTWVREWVYVSEFVLCIRKKQRLWYTIPREKAIKTRCVLFSTLDFFTILLRSSVPF